MSFGTSFVRQFIIHILTLSLLRHFRGLLLQLLPICSVFMQIDFFGVTWRKLNYRLQLLLKISPLQPEERDAGELEVYVNGQLNGYAPLYPLSIIIALSYQLDSTEAHFIRKYICRELQRPEPMMGQIYLHGNGSIN